MSVATATRGRRVLRESAATLHPKLKIDKAAGIIYGVKIAGRWSKNTHGIAGVEGTEYARAAYAGALPLYDGTKVRLNHPEHRSGAMDRDAADSLGVLRNPRIVDQGNGDYGVYADWHYLKAHPFMENVIDDVERGLGVYGMSHHAYPGQETVRQTSRGRRNVIESIVHVGGVDLVDKPGTNRNLWEDEESAALHQMDADTLLAAAAEARILIVVRDKTLSPAAKAAAIKAILDQFDELAERSPADPMRSGDGNDDDRNDRRHAAADLARQESYRRRLQAGERRVRELAEREGVKLTRGLLRAGALLESESDRLALLREFAPAPSAAAILESARSERPLRRRALLESSPPAGKPAAAPASAADQHSRLRGGR